MSVTSWTRVVAALLIVACQSATQTQPPIPTATQAPSVGPGESSSTGSQPPIGTGASQPPASSGPTESFGPAQELPLPPADSPLPEPSMTNPDDIAIALLDPSRASDGVISLVTQMGVEIDAADGTVLRPGSDTGVGLFALTEGEVRGLIDMTVEDATTLQTGTGGVALGDFFDGLQPSLPAGYTVDDLAADYSRAYSEHADALVPRVMFGMPIDPSLPLTRLQAWLIFIDGFLGRTGGAVAHQGVYAALASASLGTARSYLPALTSQVPGMTDAEWAYLLARLSTLAYAVPFTTHVPDGIQEGEAGPGAAATITAEILPPPAVTFPATGRVLLAPNQAPAGISIKWNSDDQAALAGYGSLSGDLLTPALSDGSGQASIVFTPKQEDSHGQGTLVTDVVSLYAEATASDLISSAYRVGAAGVARVLPGALIGQTSPSATAIIRALRNQGYTVRTTGARQFPIRFHAQDTYSLNIRNKFDVTIEQNRTGDTGMPELMRVRRTGRNEAQGVLYKTADGTYRGALVAWVFSDMDGSFFMGGCHDHTDAAQWLYVVGHLIAGDPLLPPFVIGPNPIGGYAQADLMLYFYPASAPAGPQLGPCQGTMEFVGGGPDGRPRGAFLPFNDSRWTAAINTNNWQDGIGLRVFLPSGSVLDYTDNRQQRPDLKVLSQWNIVVTKR